MLHDHLSFSPPSFGAIQQKAPLIKFKYYVQQLIIWDGNSAVNPPSCKAEFDQIRIPIIKPTCVI